jgi:hypothetical protein
MNRYRIVPRIDGRFSCERLYDWGDPDAWHYLREERTLERAKRYIAKCREKDREDEARYNRVEEFEKKNPPIYFD